jgi:hypothetical protein
MLVSSSSITRVLSFTSPPSLPCARRHVSSETNPLVQLLLAADAERLLHALVRTGNEAVQ